MCSKKITPICDLNLLFFIVDSLDDLSILAKKSKQHPNVFVCLFLYTSRFFDDVIHETYANDINIVKPLFDFDDTKTLLL